MTKPLSIRIPAELYDKIKALADAESRSMTSQVIYILKKYKNK